MTSATAQAVAASAERPTPAARRRDVQGLRAVAVIAVMADHVVGWPHGGFVGVDVFFVISGYLITGLLLREHRRSGTISFRGFYARRVRRILPNALLTLAVTVGLTAVLVGGSRLASTVRDAVAAALTVVNWRFAREGTDYFAQGLPPSPVQHFWSLSVEEQFYFVWPWLMLGLLVLTARRAAGRERAARHGRALFAAMSVVVGASFVWAVVQTSAQPTYAFFSTLTRVWELGLGALVAIAAARLGMTLGRARPVLAWVGLAGIVVSLLVVREDAGFPAPWAVLPVLSTALVIAAGEGPGVRGPWPLTNRFANYVGDASYSLYLWHWPVVVLLPTLLAEDSPWFVPVALAGGVALALPAYHLVENPVRHVGGLPRRETARRLRTPLVAASAITVLVVAGAAAGVRALEQNATPTATAPPAVQADCRGALALEHREACAGVTFAGMVPSPQDAEHDTERAYDCYSTPTSGARTCEDGDPDGSLRVAVVGNSHAAALLPGLLEQADERGWRVTVMVGNGCSLSRDVNENCVETSEEIRSKLLDGEPYDLVITSGSRSAVGAEKLSRVPGMAAMMRDVARRGSQVVAVSDGPIVSEAALACVARIGQDPAGCTIPLDEGFAVVDLLQLAVERVPRAHYVDIQDLYCTDTGCPVVIGGVLAYRDTAGHITATYARSLGPLVADRILAATGLDERDDDARDRTGSPEPHPSGTAADG